MLLFKLRGEFSNFRGTDTTNHRRVFLAKLHKLFTQALLLSIGSGVGVVEEGDRGDAACEPLSRGQADHERAEHILHLFVAQVLGSSDQRSGGLLTDDGLVLLCKRL